MWKSDLLITAHCHIFQVFLRNNCLAILRLLSYLQKWFYFTSCRRWSRVRRKFEGPDFAEFPSEQNGDISPPSSRPTLKLSGLKSGPKNRCPDNVDDGVDPVDFGVLSQNPFDGVPDLFGVSASDPRLSTLCMTTLTPPLFFR